MSTNIVAGILIGIVVAICFMHVAIYNKFKRKCMNQFINFFSHLGSQYNLIFSSQLILEKCIIGLDGVQRKALILNSPENRIRHYLIDLNDVESCVVKKVYGSISKNSLKNGKLEPYLKKISLWFKFISPKQPVEVLFYRNVNDHFYPSFEIEQKARNWEIIFSKLIKVPEKKTDNDSEK